LGALPKSFSFQKPTLALIVMNGLLATHKGILSRFHWGHTL